MHPQILTATLIGLLTAATAGRCSAQATAQPQRDDPSTWRWNFPEGTKAPGVEHRSLRAKAMDVEVGFNVYTPPGYADSTRRYPVVYFLHGAGGNENSDAGGFSGLIGKAIQEGKMTPALCVFPNGALSGYGDQPDRKVMMETFLTRELVPYIDTNYRTVAAREGRAVCGFSMGGGGAVRLALKHPDLFCAAASWAGALRMRPGDADPLARENLDRISGRVRLLLIVGDKDLTYESHGPFIQRLKELQVPHEYRVLPDVPHNLGLYYEKTGADMVAFLAQSLAGAAPARRGEGQPIVSPEVQADRRVTFRLRAPNAKEVTVSGEWGGGAVPMKKDDQGVWSATVGPVEPELYGYSFTVDGFRSLDPANPSVKPMRSPTTSILEVPGDPPRLYEFQDVPHGTVRLHTYSSRSLGRKRGLYVYTPPDYDRGMTRYPVLYLFHGSGDNEATWTALGRAHLILDNLLAQGKVRPMVVVMPDGHAVPPGGQGARNNTQAFERDLLEEVIPFVEHNYRVRTNASGRAIAGLSMGGGQSLTIGLNHADQFGWIGGFSSAVFNPEATLAGALSDPAALNLKLRLLWIACGKDDRLIEGSRALSQLLNSKGIDHQLVETEGNHSWPVWRRYLAQFAPLLFVEQKK